MDYIYTFLAGVVIGAIALALVFRNNTKVQNDVNKAVTQASPVVSAAESETKKL